MNELKEGVDYIAEPDKDSNFLVNITLLSGEFSGVIYRYGKVSIDEDKENDCASLSFEFDVYDAKGFIDLEDNIDFKHRIGDVLSTILIKNLPKTESLSKDFEEVEYVEE